MRDFKNMKRQRGRNRSGGGSSGGGGGKPQQNANRAFESNGPDNMKIRGHAQHVFEKYQQLSRDAMSAGDRVLGENFLQHAEHYFRLIRTLQPNRPYTDIVSRESFAAGYDIDFEEEGGGEGGEEQDVSAESGEGQQSEDRGEYRDQQPRQDRWENRDNQNRQGGDRQGGERQDYNRQDQNRQDQNRQGGYANGRNTNGGANRDRNGQNGGGFNRDRNDRWENRGDRNDGARFDNRDGQTDRAEVQGGERQDQGRYDQNRADQPRQDQPRQDQPRQDQPRQDQGRRDRPYGERGPQNGRDPLAVVEPQAAPLTAEVASPAPQAETAPVQKPARTRVLRSHDGDESHTPAFLQAAAPVAAAAASEDEAPVKRARGRPKKVKDDAPTE